jgi:hypothetical protein
MLEALNEQHNDCQRRAEDHGRGNPASRRVRVRVRPISLRILNGMLKLIRFALAAGGKKIRHSADTELMAKAQHSGTARSWDCDSDMGCINA